MNWIDLSILIVVALGAIKGLFDGVIKQAAAFLAVGLAIMFSAKLASPIAAKLLTSFELSDTMAHNFGLLIGFILILIVIPMVGRLLSKAISPTPLGLLNKLAGAVVGILLVLATMSYLFITIDSIYPIKEKEEKASARKESKYYSPIKSLVPTFLPSILLDRQKETNNE